MQTTANLKRKRLIYAVAIVLVMIAGLASRTYPGLLPASLGKYPGDALWALMVFLVFGFFLPKASSRNLAMFALSFSYLDEFSQLYQAAWINEIRATTLGHLVLGSAFCWFDLLAYTVGVLFGLLLEWAVRSVTGVVH